MTNREFWQRVYIAFIRAGGTSVFAREAADTALRHLTEREGNIFDRG